MIFDFNDLVDKIIKRKIKKADKKTELHKWFAWHPVKIESYRWVWLIVVYRKYRSVPWNVIGVFSKRYTKPLYYEVDYMKNIT